MKTNPDHEKRREQFDETCEKAFFVNGTQIESEAVATAQDIIDALKVSNLEKDKLIQHLMDKIDRLRQ